MSWLKLDDDFVHHEKILALPRADRWTWLEILSYCARNRKGRVPVRIKEVVPTATRAFLDKCITIGLLDQNGDGYYVHDWLIYNGATLTERVAAYLTDHPEATGNEVLRSIGGNRQAVLAEVERQKNGGT